jgi:tetratricopeptide (TPR) repeat protein
LSLEPAFAGSFFKAPSKSFSFKAFLFTFEKNEDIMNINPLKMFSSIFRKKADKTKSITTPIAVVQEEQKPKKEVDKNSPVYLLREATKLKHNDSTAAIELIKKAIDLEPKEQAHALKLVTYLYKSGQIDEAYATCRDLIQKLDLTDVTRYNLKKALIFEKLCTLYHRDGNFDAYLAAHTDWFYNTVIGYACQGKYKEIKKMILDKNKLKYLSPSKINSAFTKLGRIEEKEEYNNELGLMLETVSDKLFILSDAIIKARKVSKTTELMIDKLKSNDAFIEAYNELNA